MLVLTTIELNSKGVEQQKLNRGLPDSVDPGALTEIFGDDEDAKLALWQKFAIQTTQIVTNFEAAYWQRDAEKVSFQTHKLKSSARALGAHQLADLCFDLELAGKNADWGEIDNLFKAMRPAWERVKKYIDAL